ncbi:1,2-phenylacetyl-CoA epoxidase subunit PaaE [Tropicibacter naphthalenivorans]|uniref:1,2-phenylacetyl-CoA epoxidase, subunit E n=1 Tax=Tropicibacter naphthalenivorans TaxID=441103 RepID=A0A0P1GGJ7_9RHOB|nr:1,2-phenylacetyl-CoA epoxidase subunit PaaE [Tropicibacter naphthalenivorans]CUH80731.1 1,2-phenylacetyl-CoA epoxidase, subunit E [Tropicibacter naphthalenivorans]SMC89807.1 ring-1,2-phenylacetyl-CoA epoxidase subunit PaaE [Tropicibacter naphthalenivorans]
MPRFHTLDVTNVERNTRDAVTVTLRPRDGDFDFIQGQYLTFRRDFDGEELRRSYSICAGLDDGALRVGIKRVDGGAFSTWANEELQPGDTLEAMPPQGRFFTVLDPSTAKNYLGFAGGSGITPVLSIIKTTLAREPGSTFTLVYANRQVTSIMFREEIEDLKNTYLGRLSVIHILESEGDIDLFTGRIDAEKMEALFRLWIDAETVDTAFICGPEPMMLTIKDSLLKHGLTEDQVKFELFASQQGRAKKRAVSRHVQNDGAQCDVTVTLDGETRAFKMPKDGTAVLDAAIDNDMDAPYSCKAGVCSTCRAKVTEGEVEMMTNHALEDYEVRAGYVLSCQCIPLSDKVVLTYDE